MYSALAEQMMMQIRAAELPMPIREHKFIEGRKYAFDFCWPERMLALEVEGGIFVNGRHSRPKGYEADIVKYNLAQLAGWKVLRAGPVMVREGTALQHLEKALA